MKWLKRLGRILAVLLLACLLAAGVMYWMAGRTPSAYAPNLLSSEQIREASRRVDTEKLPVLYNYAGKAQVDAHVAHRDKTTPPPVEPLTVEFSQDEINAFLWKWSVPHKDRYESYVKDPFIALEPGELLVMGTVTEMDKVVSAHFRPIVDDQGLLQCELARLKIGNLPLPERLFTKYRQKVENALRDRLPQWQRGAKMTPSGTSNANTVDALLAQLVLKILDHRPVPAVLFVPLDFSGKQLVPMRLKEVKLEKASMAITVVPLSAAERTKLLETIQEPPTPGPNAPQ